VFIGNAYLTGDVPIETGLEGKIVELEGSACPSPDLPDNFGTLSLGVIVSAAIVDSINPCAIAVLLVLLAALLAAGDRGRAIKAGLAFTASIYIMYFLFGLGLLSAIQLTGFQTLVYQVVGFLAIVIGLANIKDYFWYGAGGFVMEIPRSWRPTLKGLLHRATTPLGAFGIGFLVTLFELPCTGGPYLFILGLLAEKTTQAAAIPILLFYNLFFILPLLIITLAIYFDWLSFDRVQEWKNKNIRNVHLVTGLVMLALGLLVIFRVI
jgi:cytochrome c biogenesis protein CcdA